MVADAIISVSRAHLPERIAYMIGAGAGVVMLLVLIYSRLSKDFDPATAAAIFGAGGTFTATGYGLLRSFDKTMDVVRDILLRMSAGDGAGNGPGGI